MKLKIQCNAFQMLPAFHNFVWLEVGQFGNAFTGVEMKCCTLFLTFSSQRTSIFKDQFLEPSYLQGGKTYKGPAAEVK